MNGVPSALTRVLTRVLGLLALGALTPALGAQAPRTLRVGGADGYASIGAAVAAARAGDRVLVGPGTYREPTIVIRAPGIRLEGEGWPVLDGEGGRELLQVTADAVTVRGLVFANTGITQMTDRSALRVIDAAGCRIEGNRFRNTLFGIYLQRASSCVVRDNDLRADASHGETQNGNGIHLWYSRDIRVERNRIRGHRDGIYVEFSRHALALRNVSGGNVRYGLHFMFSDTCRYVGNRFEGNAAGVAVMYSRAVEMTGNTFARAWGAGAYGLLLKEIYDGTIRGNRFAGNSVGLYLEGATRLVVADNDFVQNGFAAKVLADATGNRFTGNRFSGNAFDVATNSRRNDSTFDGNWWDAYRGYDLDGDGVGDIPFRPVRLFAVLVEQHPPALLLLRSPLVDVLDAAERVFPVLTPETLVDARPLMRNPR